MGIKKSKKMVGQCFCSHLVELWQRWIKVVWQCCCTGGSKVSHAEVAAISANMAGCRDEHFHFLFFIVHMFYI